VSFEVNIIASPVLPTFSARISSAIDEQSEPKPNSLSSFIRCGLGAAFTAKYSRKPSFQANAFFSRRAFSRIAAAS
jgi:hypothetical protein